MLPDFRVISIRLLLSFFLLLLLTACSAQTATPEPQQLRITNSGDVDITGLVVLFPGADSTSEATRIEFGDIPAGETSEYMDVPGGVYRYAAYEYTLGDRTVSQAVVDWVGESPLEGGKFAYLISLDLTRPEGSQIMLITVLVDGL